MKDRYVIGMFAHSLVSDWNHGNAHFLRGLAQSLIDRGHQVKCYEELGSWSMSNLVKTEGDRAIDAIDVFRARYPRIEVQFYSREGDVDAFFEEQLHDCDAVLVHEWNDPAFVNKLLASKQRLGFKALFHDTHHRSYSALSEILRFHLHLFDGVLAFGEAVRRIYHDGLGLERVWVFHEAADVERFFPMDLPKTADVCWVGNWGDEERTRELQEFLIHPAEDLKTHTVVYGVRYPEEALSRLAQAGIEYRGYLPNLRAPEVYGSSFLALHVPRRLYADGLAGVPTIRVFEALACGAALLCAPWNDAEGLFRTGEDYAVARDGEEMKELIRQLLRDDDARQQMGENGRQTVLARHTCGHRAEQLLEILEEIKA